MCRIVDYVLPRTVGNVYDNGFIPIQLWHAKKHMKKFILVLKVNCQVKKTRPNFEQTC